MEIKNVKYRTITTGGGDVFQIGICDDEKETCTALENMLWQYGEKHGIKAEISVWYTGENLCDFLTQGNLVDLLFLDIELISTDGIQVGNYIREELKNLETIIVYISSKSSYAMKLFEVQPLGFLIKPLKADQIEKILLKSIRLCEIKNESFEYHTKGSFHKIPYKKIIYFYSENKKVSIVTTGEEIQFNGKLKSIAAMLPHNFIMIHQSYIINLDYILEGSYEFVKMRGSTMLNISQPYRKSVRERIMQYKWERK